MEVSQRVPFLSENKRRENGHCTRKSTRKRRDPICYRALFYIASLTVVIILSFLVYHIIDLYVLPRPQLDVTQLEVKKCPGCAGQSFCSSFFRKEVHLSGIYRGGLTDNLVHQPLSGLEATIGLFDAEKPVMLRRVGSPALPQVVDEAVCRRGLPQGYRDVGPMARARLKCIPHLAIWRWRPTNSEHQSSSQSASDDGVDLPLQRRMIVAPVFQSINASLQDESTIESVWAESVMPIAFSPATRCASDRMFALLQNRFRERTSFGAETRWTRFDELMFLFNLAIDPRSIISQAFLRREHWPFPNHLGACGRWVVESKHGVPLNRFCGSPFWLRLRILHNLLTLPDHLERAPVMGSGRFSDSNYSFDSPEDLTTGYTVYLTSFDLGTTYLIDPHTYEVTVSNMRQAIIVDTQTLTDLGFSGPNVTEFAVPQNATKHLLRGLFNHQCLGDAERLGDSGGSTPPCLTRTHADNLCSHSRSDHNLWVMCTSLLYGTGSETGDSSCTSFLKDFPSTVFQLLNQCVNKPNARRATFAELRNIVHRLVSANPIPSGL